MENLRRLPSMPQNQSHELALTAVACIDVTPENTSIHTIFQTRQLAGTRLSLVSRWLSAPLVLFARHSKSDQFEDMSGVFYIGAGDQFDDDRRRIHVAV